MAVAPIPAGYATITPYLIVNDAAKAIGNTPVSFIIYVEDVDARFARAVAAGATVKRPVADQFYGDRTGTLADPFGHVWSIGTHVEDVAPDEMKLRMKKMMEAGGTL